MKHLIVVSSIFLMCLLSGCSDSDNDNGTAPVAAPTAPSGLTVISEDFTSLTLSWNASNNATGYRLYRSESASGDFTQVYSGASTEFLNTDLSYVSTYYYRVCATNSAGESDPSGTVNGTTETPAGFTVTGSPAGSVDYTFNYVGDFNGKPHYQSDPIGLNIIVPISGDQAGEWCINDQIEGINVFYHPTVSNYPSQTGWRSVLGDVETSILLTPF